MATVLVTAVGSISARIVIENLKKLGHRVIACDIYPKQWVAEAYSADVFYRAPYAADTENYLKFVETVCRTENVGYIFPLIDVEIDALNANRARVERTGAVLCLSGKAAIDICRDKYVSFQAAQKVIPDSTIPTVRLAGSTVVEFGFPRVCKRINGRSSQGLVYIRNEREWKSFMQTADIANYIAQPQIYGNISTVDIIRQKDKKKTVAIARRELLRTPSGAGTSVCVYHSEKLEEVCQRLADALDIVGCVNFEFVEGENGTFYFLECNPRFSGGVAFSCLAGYDCVKNHLRCFTGEDAIDDFVPGNAMYIARQYTEHITGVEP